MKRIIASIGLLLLACQVALGSAGSLFLCLCASSEAECAPPIPAVQEDDCCAHSDEDSVSEEDDCADILLTTEDIDTIEFNKETSKLLLLATIATFELPRLHNPASLFERQPQAARAPPEIASPQTLNTQTIKLLL